MGLFVKVSEATRWEVARREGCDEGERVREKVWIPFEGPGRIIHHREAATSKMSTCELGPRFIWVQLLDTTGMRQMR